jgi:chorismate dehydratase
MTTKIGVPSYVNAYPLIYPLTKGLFFCDVDFVFDTPRSINGMLHKGEIDVGLVSSLHFMQHQNEYEVVSTLGIAAKKKAMSVALFTKKPPHLLDGSTIAVVNSSETSAALLQVLLSQVWKVNCKIEQIEESNGPELFCYDAFLLIGDRALQLHELQGYQRIDLATEWHQTTQLPFVFALFAAKRGQNYKWLHFALRFAYEWSLKNKASLIDAAHEKLNVSKARLERYYTTLEFELSKEHMDGLQHFYSLWRKSAILPATT